MEPELRTTSGRARGTIPQLHIRMTWILIAVIYGVMLAIEYAAFGTHVDASWPYRAFFGFILAAICGAKRAFHHPIYGSRYLAWLDSTPWTPKHRLPFRRFLLSWQEVVAIALIMLASYSPTGISILIFPITLMFAYLAVAAFPLIATRQFGAIYVYAASVVAMLRLQFDTHLILGVLCVHYVLILPQLRRSMDILIWKFGIAPDDNSPIFNWIGIPRKEPRLPRIQLGFPQNMLAKKPHALNWPPRHTIGSSIAIGAFSWALLEGHAHPDVQRPDIVCALIVAIVPAIRLLAFKCNRLAPISLAGRLAMRQLIIPGHDRVYVAPLAIFAIGQLIHWALIALGAPPFRAMGIALAASTFLAIQMRPHFAEWCLTGHYRVWIAGARESGTQRV